MTVKSILPRLLQQFNHFLVENTGLDFRENRIKDLERGIKEAASHFGYEDPEECIRWLMSSRLSQKQVEILSVYLTVGETYFFRDPESYETLENYILPQILKNCKCYPPRLRIWSTACSSGEEAFSIAMVLDRQKDAFRGWDISILATDINLNALKKAGTGIYNEWSLRNTPLHYKLEYFKKLDKTHYEIHPDIRSKVQIEYLNLAENSYPTISTRTAHLDIIFCRNVLMYFRPEKARDVLNRLYHSLETGGFLFVAPTDSFHITQTQCFQQSNYSSTVYIKCEGNEKMSENSDKPCPAEDYSNVSTSFLQFSPNTIQYPPFPSIISNSSISEQEKVLPPPIESTEEHLKTINELFREGEYSKVTQLFEELTAVGNQIHKSVEFPRITPDFYELIARSYANIGKLDQATLWCTKAIEVEKLNPRYYYLQAVILIEQGNDDAAIQSIKKCLYVNPHYILAHFTIGRLYTRKNNMQESRKHLNIALSLLIPMDGDEIVSESEGLTVRRLTEIIKIMIDQESRNG